MKIKEPVNRVSVEKQKWEDREARFKQLFKEYPKATQSRAFLVEKLEYYEGVKNLFKDSVNNEERLSARFLGDVAKELEKELYPSKAVRFVRAVFNTVSTYIQFLSRTDEEPLRQVHSVTSEMNASLSKNLLRSGFGSIIKQVEGRIKQGEEVIIINVPHYYKSGQKTDFVVEIKMDESGKHHLQGFKASVPDPDNPNAVLSQQYNFVQDNQITAKKAYNQLQGRPINVKFSSGREKQQIMRGLDLYDKDNTGNFMVKDFPIDNGFDLKKDLSVLPLKGIDQPLLEKLERGLMDGNSEHVTFTKSGNEKRFYLELNPQNMEIIISDDKQRKYSLSAAVDTISHKVHTGENVKTIVNNEIVKVPEVSQLEKKAPLIIVKGMDVKETSEAKTTFKVVGKVDPEKQFQKNIDKNNKPKRKIKAI